MNTDKLRALCMSFPGVTEGIKWEDHICFMVAGKIFCVVNGIGAVTFKVLWQEIEDLAARDGINQTAYLPRGSWVTVDRFSRMKAAEWKHYITQSYELVRSKLPKKVQAGLK